MPIGDYFKYLSRTPFGYFLNSVFGTLDLHSHIRLKPVKRFLTGNMDSNVYYRVIEIGCGVGLNMFEIAKIRKRFEYVGFDLDKNSINLANELLKKINFSEKIKFICADVTKYDFGHEDCFFDIVLLLDILEHVENPVEILKNLRQKITKDAVFIVSVPTPNYPKVFGRTFHEKIGHLRDGFTKIELENLFRQVNGKLIYYTYNTGVFSSLGCAIYYRILSNNSYLNMLNGIALSPFRFLDIYNSEKLSCSLFAVFRIQN